MKFLIAGAGAIGSYIGARMCRAGLDVTLLGRGPHLQAMQEHGVKIRSAEGDFEVRPRVAHSPAEVGAVDVIFLTAKSHSLTQLAPQLKRVFEPETVVVSMQNGIPWWYFQGFSGEWDGLRLERVDPGGVISEAIEARRVIGSVVYLGTEVITSGVIQHAEGNRISLGEADGTRSDRTRKIAEALIASGFRAPVTTQLRQEIMVKLLGNASFNPVSALTRATLVQMARDPGVSALIRNIMCEVEAISHRLGMELPITIDQRIAGAEKIGEHKTSMLQDLETGRPLELEALVGSVVELGERIGVPTPYLQAVYACTKLLAASRSQTGPQPAPADAMS